MTWICAMQSWNKRCMSYVSEYIAPLYYFVPLVAASCGSAKIKGASTKYLINRIASDNVRMGMDRACAACAAACT